MVGRARFRHSLYRVSLFTLMVLLTACGGTSNPGGTPDPGDPANPGGPTSYTLVVTKAGDGGGTVTGTGIDCGEACTYSYAPGTAVVLTAVPDGGSSFVGWSGACNGQTCALTMDSAKTVTATFHQGGAPDVLIPPTTKVLSEENRNALKSYVQGTLHFDASAKLPNFSPGNVLVSEPTGAAPNGFLRKVISSRREGDEVIVETVQARLVEAIHRGQFSFKGELQAESLESVTTSHRGIEAQGYSLSVDTDFGSNGIVRATGSLAINPDYEIDGDITCDDTFLGVCAEIPDLYFKTRVVLNESSNLKIVGNAAYNINKEVELASYRFSRINIQVGPVPLVFFPRLTVYLNALGELSASFDYEVKQNITLAAGVEYRSDDGFRDLNYADATFEHIGPNYQGDAEVQSYLGVRFQVLLYDAVGPYGEFEMGAQAELHLRSKPPGYLLYHLEGCVAVNAGLKIDIFIYEESYEKQLAKKCETIISRTNSPPSVKILSPNTFQTVYLGSPTPLEAEITNRDRDVLSCKWTSSVVSDVLPPESCEAQTMTFSTLGVRTLTLAVDDGVSGAASASVTIDVKEVPEIVVEIVSPQAGTELEIPNSSSSDTATVTFLDAEVVSGDPVAFNWLIYLPVDSQGGTTAETRPYPIASTTGNPDYEWHASDFFAGIDCSLFSVGFALLELNASRQDGTGLNQDRTLIHVFRRGCVVE